MTLATVDLSGCPDCDCGTYRDDGARIHETDCPFFACLATRVAAAPWPDEDALREAREQELLERLEERERADERERIGSGGSVDEEPER